MSGINTDKMRPFTHAPDPQESANGKIEFREALTRVAIDTPGLIGMEIAEKRRILGEFFREGDIGFLYAERGLGKTWLTYLIAGSIARGEACGEWTAGDRPCNVLIIDGEMALRQTQERIRALQMDSPHLLWLHHERLFRELELTFNIAKQEQQEAITAFALTNRIDVIFLDNLSSLAFGLAENQADDWEAVSPWLLILRRHNIAVVLVAHAGRNGLLRGTSKREDLVNWIVKLKPPQNPDSFAKGAQFVSLFEKNRNSTPDLCPPLRWIFERGDPVSYTCVQHTDYDAFLALVRDGVDSNKDICERLDVPKGTVSKWAHKAEGDGLIKIEGRKYYPVKEGE